MVAAWNLFIRNPADLDWDAIERVTNEWMLRSYKPYLREKFYDRIPRRLLVEPLIGPRERLPVDYKFFCFGGRVEYVMAQSDRETGMKIETLDREWRPLSLRYAYDRPGRSPSRPFSFERMRAAAERLSGPFDFCPH